MTSLNLILTLASVSLICIGQILFKWIGIRLHQGVPIQDVRLLGIAGIALLLYGSATLLWIWILRTTPLTRAYPFMALSFVFVPLASVLIFSERINTMYLVGLAFIVSGVVMTAYFRS